MAKSRLITTNLIRVFDRISEPIFLIGHDNLIIYANQIGLEWIRLDSEQIKSARCIYTSQKLDNPIDDRVKGLAPPPLSDAGKDKIVELYSAFCKNDKGECGWRKAIALRLSGDEKPDSTLVVCSAVVLDGPTDLCDELAEEDRQLEWCTNPVALHEALMRTRELLDNKYNLETVIGLESTSRSLVNKIETAIKTKASVVIFGPSGSGREHLARTIDAQRRADSVPPIPLHCAVADQQLIQRNIKELSSERISSRAVEANECLLLIEVDQLSVAAQSELWGFLQIPGVSFQTIATASRSLIELSRQNKFHAGLAGSLSTLEIELLPLNRRPADIPLLAQACLEEINLTRSKQLAGFSADAMQLLQQFNWPDNIDQLSRDVHAAANAAQSNKIDLEDLPPTLRQASRALDIGQLDQVEIKLDEYLMSIENELILRAVKQSKGNKSRAAKLLGISRPKLLRRLQLLKLTDEQPRNAVTEQLDSSAFEEAEDHD